MLQRVFYNNGEEEILKRIERKDVPEELGSRRCRIFLASHFSGGLPGLRLGAFNSGLITRLQKFFISFASLLTEGEKRESSEDTSAVLSELGFFPV